MYTLSFPANGDAEPYDFLLDGSAVEQAVEEEAQKHADAIAQPWAAQEIMAQAMAAFSPVLCRHSPELEAVYATAGLVMKLEIEEVD